MRKNILNQPVLLLKLVASVMYIAMGVFVLYIPGLISWLGTTLSYALGALLIVYGVFRLIRVVNELRENSEE